MTKIFSCHLLDMLAEVLPDPRNKKGQRHSLVSMLALTVVGLLCGQRSWTAIAKWARLYPDLRKALGFTAKQTPAASTFHYFYRRTRHHRCRESAHEVDNTDFSKVGDLHI